MENTENLEERGLTGKLIMIVLDGEILSVIQHEGVTEINSDEAEIYINTKDRLIMIATTLGIDDTSKLDEF